MNLNTLFESLRTENPCWKGYKPVGTKEKNGRTVPNCVPKEDVEEAYPGHIQKGKELDAATKKIQANLDKRIKKAESPASEIERLKLRQNAEHGGASLKRQAATQARIRELEKQIKDKKGVAEGWMDDASPGAKDSIKQDKIRSLKNLISSYEEKAIAANRAGDDAKTKQYQQRVQQYKQELGSLVKEGVSEGVATTLPLNDALKLLRQYGAEAIKTGAESLNFYKGGKPYKLNLNWNDDTTRSVSLGELNHVVRALKAQDNKFNFNPDDNWSQDFETRMSNGVAEGSELKKAKRAYNQAAKDANADQVGAGKKIDTMKKSLRQKDVGKSIPESRYGRGYSSYHDELRNREREEQGYMDQQRSSFKRQELQHELGHERNNIQVVINGRPWKVFPGQGYADSQQEFQHLQKMKAWAEKKSAATGKKWTVYLTGAEPTA